MSKTKTKPRKRGRKVGSPYKLDGSIRICITLDAATLARLDAKVNKRKETRSQVIRSLIDNWE